MRDKVLDISFPNTIKDFKPTDEVYTCIGKLKSLGDSQYTSMWKAAFFTEEDLRKYCFWMNWRPKWDKVTYGASPCIEPPEVIKLSANDFVERAYEEDPNGMNPFETLARFEFIKKWREHVRISQE